MNQALSQIYNFKIDSKLEMIRNHFNWQFHVGVHFNLIWKMVFRMEIVELIEKCFWEICNFKFYQNICSKFEY